MQYFIYYRNFATKIQIIFDKESVFISNFCNYDTILYIFNYKIDIGIANWLHIMVRNSSIVVKTATQNLHILVFYKGIR